MFLFVQVSEPQIGLARTMTGTCEIILLSGETLLLPFAPRQVTLTPASWSLDCASHQFSFSALTRRL
jgi:hypothetical protein